MGQARWLLQAASPPGSLRWARGREGCFDSPLSPSGHPSPLDGLWLPAYATALEWALHPAGHGPNNSSLFLPQAAVVVVARKGLLAPFRPQRGRLHPKILKIHAIRREDLFTVFSASADLKGPSVAARQLPGGERCRKRHLICCALAAGQQQPMPLLVTTLPVKKQIRRGRSPAGFAKSKIILLLFMPRAKRRAF